MKIKRSLAPFIIAAVISLGSIAIPTASATATVTKSAVANTNKAKKPPAKRAKPKADQSSHEGATAECNDGTYSYSAHHRGTCSHHGGVKRWFK
jgi:hypothetical protein